MLSIETISPGFDSLHPGVQRWIWQQGWTDLRDLQQQAIAPILERRDIIIAAATASGKTEAAFLPIASALAARADGQGLAIYISPLKALINDQYRRLTPLFEALNFGVWPWHADVGSGVKERFRGDGTGALLITPESIEAMFVRSGYSIPHLFRHAQYIVVDELHSFLGSERGKQLQSLMCRLELAAGRRIPRIGLSATLGDMTLAADYLRPHRANTVQVIQSEVRGNALKLLIRGYEGGADPGGPADHADGRVKVDSVQEQIAEDLFTPYCEPAAISLSQILALM
jgi:ATP-dependent helicase Lhr and Lhr-like helicase